MRANVICPGFVRTPLVDKQIPEQAKELGITEEEVVKNVMLKDTVDGEFTTVEDVAASGAVLRRLPDQRADRPVADREPRLVHGVSGTRLGVAHEVASAFRLAGSRQNQAPNDELHRGRWI